jgi:hypothetical protein
VGAGDKAGPLDLPSKLRAGVHSIFGTAGWNNWKSARC